MTLRAYGPDAVFCPRCAGRLPGAPPTVCGSCGYALFVNARPTANLIVLDRDPGAPPPGSGPAVPRFLALRRAAEPRAGRWETPGGFCDGWEHPADAAVREGREELGVEVDLGECVGMFLGSYEFQRETLPVLDIFFLATIGAGEIRLNPAESSDLTWFSLAEPPPLAFATMDAAVAATAGRLRV